MGAKAQIVLKLWRIRHRLLKTVFGHLNCTCNLNHPSFKGEAHNGFQHDFSRMFSDKALTQRIFLHLATSPRSLVVFKEFECARKGGKLH